MAVQIFAGIDAVPLKVFKHGWRGHDLAEREARGHKCGTREFGLHGYDSENKLTAIYATTTTPSEIEKAKSVARLGFSFRGLLWLRWFRGTARYAPFFQVIRANWKDRALFNFAKTKRLECTFCEPCKG